VEPLFKSLYKFKIHPYFIYPFKEKFTQTEFDLASEWKAKESNNPEKIFNQLINEIKSPDEIVIYTDGSKTKINVSEEGSDLVSCAILIPH